MKGPRGGAEGPGWCVPRRRGWGLAEWMAPGPGPPRRRLHPSAQVLDLSHNELSFVPPDLPEALEELHLQGNCIGHVGSEAFLSTPRLRALFLRCPGAVRQIGSGWVGWGGPGGLWRTPAGLGGSGWLWPPPLAPTLMPASWSRANRLHMTSIAPEAFLGLLHLSVVDTAGNPEQVLVQLPPTAPRQPRAGGP